MKTSYKGQEAIAREEGIVLVTYDDVGTPAIGIGHQDKTLPPDKKITIEEAMQIFAKDLETFEKRVDGIFQGHPLTQQQFDALVSFAFNLGSGTLERSSIPAKLKAGKVDEAMSTWAAYNKVNGETNAGLSKRRNNEIAIFTKGDYGNVKTVAVWEGNPRTTKPVSKPFPAELPASTSTITVTVNAASTPATVNTKPVVVSIPTTVATPVKEEPAVAKPYVEPAAGKWPGTVGQPFTKNQFAEYVKTLKFGSWKPTMIVLHNTGAPKLSQWHSTLGVQRMKNLTHYYKNQQGWAGGPHLFVADDLIWVFCPLTSKGVHSPSWNATAWGIEMVGDYDVEKFDAGVRDNAAAAIKVLSDWAKIDLDKNLKLHKEDPKTTHKNCPGKNVSKADMIARAKAWVPTFTPNTQPIPVKPVPAPAPVIKAHKPGPADTVLINYVVSKGDTLYSIANTAGVSVMDLMDWNGLVDNSVIKAGDSLKVWKKPSQPTVTPVTVTTSDGNWFKRFIAWLTS